MAGGVIATTKLSSSLSSSLSQSLATVFFIVLAAFVVAACRRAAVARDRRDRPFPRVDTRRVVPTVLLTSSLDARRPRGRLFFDCCVLVALTVAFFDCCVLCIRNGGHGGHDCDRRDHRRRRVDYTTINCHAFFFLAYSRSAYLDFASEQVKD